MQKSESNSEINEIEETNNTYSEEEENNSNSEPIVSDQRLDELDQIQELSNKETMDTFNELYKTKPFKCLHYGCQKLVSISDKKMVESLIINIASILTKNKLIWMEKYASTDQKNFIKSILLKFMDNPDEIVYKNAALSFFIICSLEFQNNELPSFFNDIFNIIHNASDELRNSLQKGTPINKPIILASIYIIENSIEKNILPSHAFFNQCMNKLCNIYNEFLTPSNFSYDQQDDRYNDFSKFLYKIRYECLILLKISLPLLKNQVNTENQCSELIKLLYDLLFSIDNIINAQNEQVNVQNEQVNNKQRKSMLITNQQCSEFYSLVYEIFGLLFTYYYSAASNSIKLIFDQTNKILKDQDNKKKISALNFWITISNVETSMMKSKNIIQLHYFTLGVYKHIYPFLIQIFEQINLETIEYDGTDEFTIEEVAINYLHCLALTDPGAIIPIVCDFIREHIKKNKSNSSHYSALQVLLAIIQKCQYHEISPFLGQILECTENSIKNYKLTIASLKVISKIIKYFQNIISLSDINSIISACQNILREQKIIQNQNDTENANDNNRKNDLEISYENEKYDLIYTQAYKVLSKLIILLNTSINSKDFNSETAFAHELFQKIQDLVLKGADINISLSYVAIISLIQNSRDHSFLISFFENMLTKIQNVEKQDKKSEFQVNSDICQILKNCIINFQMREINIQRFIDPLSQLILDNFNQNYDEDLLELAGSFIPNVLKSENIDFLNQLMPNVMNLFFATNNDQRIFIAAEFISDITIANPSIIDYPFLNRYKVFTFYENILQDPQILRSTHAPILSSLADIIDAQGHESLQIRVRFIPIIYKFTNVPLDKSSQNDFEYANELFESLCRVYAAITNFSSDSTDNIIEVTNHIFNFFKRIHQLEIYMNNDIILKFIVCIVNNLLSIDESRNRISFLAHNQSMKEMLTAASKVKDQSEECRERAKSLIHFFYPIQ